MEPLFLRWRPLEGHREQPLHSAGVSLTSAGPGLYHYLDLRGTDERMHTQVTFYAYAENQSLFYKVYKLLGDFVCFLYRYRHVLVIPAHPQQTNGRGWFLKWRRFLSVRSETFSFLVNISSCFNTFPSLESSIYWRKSHRNTDTRGSGRLDRGASFWAPCLIASIEVDGGSVPDIAIVRSVVVVRSLNAEPSGETERHRVASYITGTGASKISRRVFIEVGSARTAIRSRGRIVSV